MTIKKLALTLPGWQTPINSPVDVGSGKAISESTLGGVLTGLLNVVFYLSFFLMFIWITWGIFEYIFAGGEKEKLGKARQRITWAIVGFLITVLAFVLKDFAQGIFNPSLPAVRPITAPII